MDDSNCYVANYVLESVLKDLSFLKDNNFLAQKTYNEVVALLPSRIQQQQQQQQQQSITDKPPLPTRRSTNSVHSTTPPVPQPREFPKLPVRRTPEWQAAQPPQPHMPSPKSILHSEPERTTPPPPAYTQKPSNDSPPLATAEALYDYDGEDSTTDLSFKQGDIIEVTEYVNDDWWKGTVNGKSGIFPQNHVKKIAPPVKAKRPWVPPTSSKPSFSTPNTQSSYTSSIVSSNNNHNNNAPYSYPPPPQAMYAPPPTQAPAQQNYGQPSTVIINHVGNNPEEDHNGGDKKVANMAKKFGGNIATAATWGFGATLGSQAANAIF